MANYVTYDRPYDSEVEYLESVANSTYIDTLLKPSNNIDCEISAQRAKVTVATDAIFGGGIGYGSSYAVVPHKNTEIILLYGNASKYIATNNCFARPWVVKNIGGKFYINNTEYELNPSTEEWTFKYNIYLFACNYSGLARRQTTGYIRIYYAKFWDNGVLVRDFIPVRVGSVGYMYDKVSKKLFGNKGTGNFILGSDVANPIPNIRRVFRFGNKRFVMPEQLKLT